MTKHIYATLVIVLLAANLYATTKNSQAIAKAQADIDDIESFTFSTTVAAAIAPPPTALSRPLPDM